MTDPDPTSDNAYLSEQTIIDRIKALEHQNGTLLYLSGLNLVMNILTIMVAVLLT